MLPVIASFGVSIIPALIYLRVVEALDEPVLSLGWPVTLTTELAFAYFIARVIFRSHPMIPFLLLLGIAADALGFLVLALFNPLREVISPVASASWRERSASRPVSMVARPQLLAISARRRERLLVWLVLERLASRARARSNHAVPPSRGA